MILLDVKHTQKIARKEYLNEATFSALNYTFVYSSKVYFCSIEAFCTLS